MEDEVLRHQVFLERLKAGLTKDLVKAIKQVDREITKVLRTIEEPNLSELTRQKLESILSQLRKVQIQLLGAAIQKHLKELKRLASYEAQFEGKVLKRALRRIRVQVPKARLAYREALKRPLASTGELLEPFLKNWVSKEIAVVQNTVRKGYASGWTNQQLERAIRGTKKARYTDGVLGRAEKNANIIVRTSVQHVSSSARALTLAMNSDIVEKYKIVATLDDRTSAICRSLDGQVFELGKGPIPPLHPGCRSTMVAVLPEEFDFLQEGATRSSAQGYVERDLTYYEWLKRQPASFQDKVLGPTRGKLFRDGGLTVEEFRRLNLNRNFEPLTLEQMRELEPEAFKRAGL